MRIRRRRGRRSPNFNKTAIWVLALPFFPLAWLIQSLSKLIVGDDQTRVDIRPLLPDAIEWIPVTDDISIVISEHLYEPDHKVVIYTSINWQDYEKEEIKGPFKVKVRYKRGKKKCNPYIKLGDEEFDIKTG